MTLISKFAAAGLAAAALVAPSTAPAAAPSMSGDRAPCFFVRNWQGWSAPDDSTVLLRVNRNDIYKVDVTRGARQLRTPGAFLISKTRGGSVCSHLDLDLQAADTTGFSFPLIARSITRLSPQEVAALAKKDLP